MNWIWGARGKEDQGQVLDVSLAQQGDGMPLFPLRISILSIGQRLLWRCGEIPGSGHTTGCFREETPKTSLLSPLPILEIRTSHSKVLLIWKLIMPPARVAYFVAFVSVIFVLTASPFVSFGGCQHN